MDLQNSLIAGAREALKDGPIYCDDFSTTAPDLLTRAEEGDMTAQYDLGSDYLGGDGVERDTSAAIDWLTKAAEQGEQRAATQLMDVYTHDKDLQDSEKAYFWELIGKPLYNDGAHQEPETKLSADQKAEVEKRAAEWKPSPGPNAHKYDPLDTLLSVPCRAEITGNNFDRDADAGDAYAQIAFGKYLKARKNWTSPDYSGAYFWFSLAARKLDFAIAPRDEAAKHLSDYQKLILDKKIQIWTPTERSPPVVPMSSKETSSTISAATEPGARKQQGSPRNLVGCTFWPEFFNNLANVYIKIDYDSVFREAGKCQGREEACARLRFTGSELRKSSETPKIAESVKKEEDRLRLLYKDYPHPLSFEVLTDRFRAAVESSLSEFGNGSKCPLPNPKLLDYHGSSSVIDQSEDALTIALKLTIVQTAPERIAVLAITYYRPDERFRYYLMSTPWLTAIPLNLSDAKIE